MQQILTIVNTAGLPIETRLSLETFLEKSGLQVGEMQQLDNAVDVAFTGTLDEATLARWAAARHVDYAVQDAATRHKKLLISDMESTLVENEFLDDIAAFCGVGDNVKAITARAMNGEIDFASSLQERVRLLAGQPVGILERAYDNLHWMPGAQELFSSLRLHGIRTIIVSGGFKYFTSRVREILGAGEDFSNDLIIEDGKLTGEPLLPVAGREEKERILRETAASMGISLAETVAVGDGANDLPMLLTAGLGVAFRAKPAVNSAAKYRVQHSDLRAVLYFMGIAEKQ
ncbi:MAG TPA: phosphoserine phosphatase SerB [Chthoniobacterales bacterium]|jgi:phosphoserine phosphatase